MILHSHPLQHLYVLKKKKQIKMNEEAWLLIENDTKLFQFNLLPFKKYFGIKLSFSHVHTITVLSTDAEMNEFSEILFKLRIHFTALTLSVWANKIFSNFPGYPKSCTK